MGIFFVYILKSSFCLAAFYLFYRLLLSRDTFHGFNRVMLLLLMLLSCLLPFIEATTAHPSEMNQTLLTVEDLIMMQYATTTSVIATPVVSSLTWADLVLIIYWGGILFFLFRNMYAIWKMFTLIHSGWKRKDDNGVLLVVHHRKVPPFSWMKYIVISEKDFNENGKEILVHEKAHIANHHSWDVMLADVFVFLQWFNPAAWLLKQELQNIHEYEADDTVLRKGIDAKSYQLLLIEKAVGPRLYSIANSFNHSSLKKRIAMMLKQKSNPWARLKYLYVLPVAALAVVAFARPEISNKLEELSEVKVTKISSIVKEEAAKITENVLPDASELLPEVVKNSANNMRVSPSKEFIVKGLVTDETRKPVAGASILIQNTTKGTLCDRNGEFSLPAREGDVICISFIGKQTVKFPVKASMEGTQITLTMLEDVTQLDEVVAVAYGDNSEDKDKLTVVGSKNKEENTSLDKEELVFQVVEEMPSYPGGMNECLKFLASNIKYPVDAHKAGIQGRVIAQFVVKSDGSIDQVEIVRSISPSLDNEAIRVVKMMPKWIPGKQRGKTVNVKYTLPISFKLQGKSDNQEEGKVNFLVVIDGVVSGESSSIALKKLSPESISEIKVIKESSQLRPYIQKYGAEKVKGGVMLITTAKKK